MKRPILRVSILVLWALAWPSLAEQPPNLDPTIAAQEGLVAREPGNATAWNDLGNLLTEAGREGEAEEAYRRAVSIDPASTAARFNLAVLLQQNERKQEAETELRALLEIDPHHAWGHYQLGVLMAPKDRRKAIEHYARAIAYNPTLSFARNNPHILDNPLFTEALLRSQRYSEELGARVPREYGEPDRIVELMLRKPGEEGEAEKTTGEENGEGDAMASPQSGGDSQLPEAGPGGADLTATRRDPGAASARPGTSAPVVAVPGAARPAPSPNTAGRPPQTVETPGAERVPPTRSVQPPSRSRTLSVPPPPPSSADRRRTPTVRPATPPPPRSSRYIPAPSRRSSAQLDLRLLPEDEPVQVADIDPRG